MSSNRPSNRSSYKGSRGSRGPEGVVRGGQVKTTDELYLAKLMGGTAAQSVY
jgi:hypothetical protein